MPAYKYDTPSWAKQEDASVFDSPITKAIRMLAGLIGADDPQSQVVGLMNPTDVANPTGGVLGALNRVGKKIKAYHGSPHDFDKFSLEKIGTGEGAQAYGHGLYFAESPDVAKSYADDLGYVRRAKEPAAARGISYPPGTSRHRALMDVVDVGKEKALQRLDADIRFNETYAPDMANLQRSVREWIADLDPSEVTAATKGKTYEVEINADPEDFLDWDRPLSQQSEKVRQALNQDMSAIADTAANPDIQQQIRTGALKGEKAYHLLGGEKHVASGFSTPPPQAAAAALRERGVPGLKYYDSGSRTAAGGFSSADRAGADRTRNYVVFDDSIINILRKYGLLLPASGAALAAGSQAGAPQTEAPPDPMREALLRLMGRSQ